jgi:hypothetical protein
MVRFAPVVAPDIPHYITQRGNACRFILEGDAERSVYLDLLQQGVQLSWMAKWPITVRFQISIMNIGECVMFVPPGIVESPLRGMPCGSAMKGIQRWWGEEANRPLAPIPQLQSLPTK